MNSELQKLSQLPSLPTVAVRLLRMFSDPDVSISDVVFVLQTDPALSGKILKAANTSQFGLKKPVSDLQRAVVLLGKKSVTALALGFSLAEASMSTGPYAHLYSDFWFQSLVRGCAASVLADQYSTVDSGEAFTIGLLARIGRLALLNHKPEEFVGYMQQAEDSAACLDDVEREFAEITSTQVSMHMLREWKLPEHCLTAVENLPASVEVACKESNPESVSLTDIVRIAAAFADFFSGEQRGLAIARVYELTGAILGISEEDANGLVDRIRAELDDHSDLFSVDMAKVGSPLELLSQAMGQLSMLAASASMVREESRALNCEMREENGRLRKRVLELTQSMMTDPLTTLYNRAYLVQQLEDRTEIAQQQESPVAVLFIDVDHFKDVNDTHGHLLGDEVLKSISRILKDTVRQTDVVTRYGGEEFVILAAAKDIEGLQMQAERLRMKIEANTIEYGSQQLRVTVSIGGAIAVPEPAQEEFPALLLELADVAMYQSKRGGRNRVTILSETPTAEEQESVSVAEVL